MPWEIGRLALTNQAHDLKTWPLGAGQSNKRILLTNNQHERLRTYCIIIFKHFFYFFWNLPKVNYYSCIANYFQIMNNFRNPKKLFKNFVHFGKRWTTFEIGRFLYFHKHLLKTWTFEKALSFFEFGNNFLKQLHVLNIYNNFIMCLF